jgi:predicted PurR-regulated permease PerM
MGLDFALLIGLLICVLALIPYIGITLCWIPAVLIATLQWNDWLHPIIVTIIFIVVQQIEGWLIAPRIVGNSVGLHPLTVIVAVFGWSLLIGGLLGAILAVPLTATIKVLLHRYVWQRQFKASTITRSPLEEPPPDSLSARV